MDAPFQIGLLLARVIPKSLTPRHFDLFVFAPPASRKLRYGSPTLPFGAEKNTKEFLRFPPEVRARQTRF